MADVEDFGSPSRTTGERTDVAEGEDRLLAIGLTKDLLRAVSHDSVFVRGKFGALDKLSLWRILRALRAALPFDECNGLPAISGKAFSQLLSTVRELPFQGSEYAETLFNILYWHGGMVRCGKDRDDKQVFRNKSSAQYAIIPEACVSHRLRIEVVSAARLLGKDSSGLSDPFVSIQLGNQVVETSIVVQELDPEWGETFDLGFTKDDRVDITVWDYNRYSSNDFLGQFSFHVSDISGWRSVPSSQMSLAEPSATVYQETLQLQKRSRKSHVDGTLTIRVQNYNMDNVLAACTRSCDKERDDVAILGFLPETALKILDRCSGEDCGKPLSKRQSVHNSPAKVAPQSTGLVLLKDWLLSGSCNISCLELVLHVHSVAFFEPQYRGISYGSKVWVRVRLGESVEESPVEEVRRTGLSNVEWSPSSEIRMGISKQLFGTIDVCFEKGTLLKSDTVYGTAHFIVPNLPVVPAPEVVKDAMHAVRPIALHRVTRKRRVVKTGILRCSIYALRSAADMAGTDASSSLADREYSERFPTHSVNFVANVLGGGLLAQPLAPMYNVDTLFGPVSCRLLTYTMPNLPGSAVMERQWIPRDLICNYEVDRAPSGYVVRSSVLTPNVRFGDRFETLLSYSLIKHSDRWTQLWLTHEMHFFDANEMHSLVVRLIRRLALRGIRTTYAKYETELKKWADKYGFSEHRQDVVDKQQLITKRSSSFGLLENDVFNTLLPISLETLVHVLFDSDSSFYQEFSAVAMLGDLQLTPWLTLELAEFDGSDFTSRAQFAPFLDKSVRWYTCMPPKRVIQRSLTKADTMHGMHPTASDMIDTDGSQVVSGADDTVSESGSSPLLDSWIGEDGHGGGTDWVPLRFGILRGVDRSTYVLDMRMSLLGMVEKWRLLMQVRALIHLSTVRGEDVFSGKEFADLLLSDAGGLPDFRAVRSLFDSMYWCGCISRAFKRKRDQQILYPDERSFYKLSPLCVSEKRLYIEVLRATNLVAKDHSGYSDPFVSLDLLDQHGTTSVQIGTLDPAWNERFDFGYTSLDDEIDIQVWSWSQVGSNDYLGSYKFKIRDALDWYSAAFPEGLNTQGVAGAADSQESGLGTVERELVLQKRNIKSVVSGSLTLRIAIVDVRQLASIQDDIDKEKLFAEDSDIRYVGISIDSCSKVLHYLAGMPAFQLVRPSQDTHSSYEIPRSLRDPVTLVDCMNAGLAEIDHYEIVVHVHSLTLLETMRSVGLLGSAVCVQLVVNDAVHAESAPVHLSGRKHGQMLRFHGDVLRCTLVPRMLCLIRVVIPSSRTAIQHSGSRGVLGEAKVIIPHLPVVLSDTWSTIGTEAEDRHTQSVRRTRSFPLHRVSDSRRVVHVGTLRGTVYAKYSGPMAATTVIDMDAPLEGTVPSEPVSPILTRAKMLRGDLPLSEKGIATESLYRILPMSYREIEVGVPMAQEIQIKLRQYIVHSSAARDRFVADMICIADELPLVNNFVVALRIEGSGISSPQNKSSPRETELAVSMAILFIPQTRPGNFVRRILELVSARVCRYLYAGLGERVEAYTRELQAHNTPVRWPACLFHVGTDGVLLDDKERYSFLDIAFYTVQADITSVAWTLFDESSHFWEACYDELGFVNTHIQPWMDTITLPDEINVVPADEKAEVFVDAQEAPPQVQLPEDSAAEAHTVSLWDADDVLKFWESDPSRRFHRIGIHSAHLFKDFHLPRRRLYPIVFSSPGLSLLFLARSLYANVATAREDINVRCLTFAAVSEYLINTAGVVPDTRSAMILGELLVREGFMASKAVLAARPDHSARFSPSCSYYIPRTVILERRLHVEVIKADSFLPSSQSAFSRDDLVDQTYCQPYIIASCGEQLVQTCVHLEDPAQPSWNEVFNFGVPDQHDLDAEIHFELGNYRIGCGSDALFAASLNMHTVLAENPNLMDESSQKRPAKDIWLTMHPTQLSSTQGTRQLLVRISYSYQPQTEDPFPRTNETKVHFCPTMGAIRDIFSRLSPGDNVSASINNSTTVMSGPPSSVQPRTSLSPQPIAIPMGALMQAGGLHEGVYQLDVRIHSVSFFGGLPSLPATSKMCVEIEQDATHRLGTEPFPLQSLGHGRASAMFDMEEVMSVPFMWRSLFIAIRVKVVSSTPASPMPSGTEMESSYIGHVYVPVSSLSVHTETGTEAATTSSAIIGYPLFRKTTCGKTFVHVGMIRAALSFSLFDGKDEAVSAATDVYSVDTGIQEPVFVREMKYTLPGTGNMQVLETHSLTDVDPDALDLIVFRRQLHFPALREKLPIGPITLDTVLRKSSDGDEYSVFRLVGTISPVDPSSVNGMPGTSAISGTQWIAALVLSSALDTFAESFVSFVSTWLVERALAPVVSGSQGHPHMVFKGRQVSNVFSGRPSRRLSSAMDLTFRVNLSVLYQALLNDNSHCLVLHMLQKNQCTGISGIQWRSSSRNRMPKHTLVLLAADGAGSESGEENIEAIAVEEKPKPAKVSHRRWLYYYVVAGVLGLMAMALGMYLKYLF